MAEKKRGLCRLCNTDTELTFEHIPPRNAYNKNKYFLFPQDAALNDPFLEDFKGRPIQGGVGYNALCEQCNNKTGGWYGKSYIEFANQAVYRLRLSPYKDPRGDVFVIHPSKILKQVISFFITIGNINYYEHYPELTKFVLDKNCKTLPDNYQVFMYYNDSDTYRYMADNFISDGGIMWHVSEVAHWPFGFILSFEKTEKPLDNRLVEITSWKNYPFQRGERLIMLPLQVLPVELAMFPGDFRERQVIEAAIAESEKKYGKS